MWKIIKKLLPFIFLAGVITSIYFVCKSHYGTRANEDAFISLSVMLFGFGLTFGSVLKSICISIGTFVKSKSKDFKQEIKTELEKKKKKQLSILDNKQKNGNKQDIPKTEIKDEVSTGA